MANGRVRRALRPILLALGALAFVVVAGAVVDLVRIKGDLDAGHQTLDHLDLDTLRDVGLEGAINGAADHLAAAHHRAETSPFLAALSPLPVVDDQVHAIRDLTGAADDLGGESRVSGRRIADALDRASGSPGARIDLLDTVLGELDRVEQVSADIDLGADGRLVGPLRSARADVADSLASVPDEIEPVKDQVRALRRLLSGPTSYLVMVGNNAEMRAGAGMPLQIGVASINGGDIHLGEFKPATSDLFTTHPTGRYNAHIPPELSRTYPNWLLGEDFPETAVIPEFPRTAPIFADIAADTQGWTTEGVIHIDAMALSSLLDVVGPIVVDGVEYNSETAPQLVLNQTYLDWDGVPRALRRDAQSGLAQALFDAIEHRDVDLLDVIGALQTAAEGRHLMAWSRDPLLEDLFSSFGADGAVSPYQTLVSLQNTAANKLDWYVYPTIDVSTTAVDGEWEVTLTTTVHHPHRALTVDYIEGPYLPDGEHRALLTVQVPRFAEDLQMPGAQVTEYGDDGTSLVIGTRFVIPRGETRTVVTRFRLPRDVGRLAVLPSARVKPVPWTVNGTTYDDHAAFVASFGPYPDAPDHPAWQIFALIAVLVAAAGTVTIANGARRPGADPRTARLVHIDNVTGVALCTIGFAVAVVAFVLAG